MSPFDGLRRWLRVPRRPKESAARDVEEEFGFHLEMRARELESQGFARMEARMRAEREFGDMEQARRAVVAVAAEVARKRRRRRWFDEFRQDTRYGWRKIAASPGFSAVAIATLALGIGFTSAIFSVVNGVLLRPLPWLDAERLVMVWENDRVSGTAREPASYPDYVDFQERNRVFESMAYYAAGDLNLTRPGTEPERVRTALVSHELFPLLGVSPLLGRGIDASEDVRGGARVALLSEGYWRSHFGADRSVPGREIQLDGASYQVVGVMPDEVQFPEGAVRIWTAAQGGPVPERRETHPIYVIARLRAGLSLAAAQAEMTRIAADLESEYPQSNTARGVLVEPLTEVVFAGSRPALLVLLSGVGLLLVIACANVASLLLARGMARSREVAVRAALGASTVRLTRQFIIESVMLSLIATGLGVVFARLSLGALLAVLPADLPRAALVSVDLRVLGLAVAIAFVVGIVFGLMPALQARRFDVQQVLKAESDRGASSGRSRQLARSALVVSEVAISVILVMGAALLIRTVMQLRAVDPGFRSAGVFAMEFQLPEARYPRDFSRYPNWPHLQFYDQLNERLTRVPGVSSVALSAYHPLASGFTNSFVIVGREQELANQPEIAVRAVSAGYAATLGVPVLAGRDLNERDRADAAPVVLINEAAARRFFPTGDAIGKQLRWWGVTREIVGIIGNQRMYGLTADAPPAVYVALPQAPMQSGTILIRAEGDGDRIMRMVTSAVREVDPSLALFNMSTLEQAVSNAMTRERSTMLLLGCFAAVALLLALIGVHGVLSYSVTQRTRELGVRVALGASKRNVLGMVALQGVRLAAFGIVLGVIGSLLATRALSGLLFGVTATDPATFVTVTLLIILVSAAASWLPARRAVSIDPMRALRTE